MDEIARVQVPARVLKYYEDMQEEDEKRKTQQVSPTNVPPENIGLFVITPPASPPPNSNSNRQKTSPTKNEDMSSRLAILQPTPERMADQISGF